MERTLLVGCSRNGVVTSSAAMGDVAQSTRSASSSTAYTSPRASDPLARMTLFPPTFPATRARDSVLDAIFAPACFKRSCVIGVPPPDKTIHRSPAGASAMVPWRETFTCFSVRARSSSLAAHVACAELEILSPESEMMDTLPVVAAIKSRGAATVKAARDPAVWTKRRLFQMFFNGCKERPSFECYLQSTEMLFALKAPSRKCGRRLSLRSIDLEKEF
jgi:hypothetical protein